MMPEAVADGVDALAVADGGVFAHGAVADVEGEAAIRLEAMIQPRFVPLSQSLFQMMAPLPSLPPKGDVLAEASNGCFIQNATEKSWAEPKGSAAGAPSVSI